MSRHLKNYVATRAATRLVMDAAQSEKAKAGRVTMPKVFFVIGIKINTHLTASINYDK